MEEKIKTQSQVVVGAIIPANQNKTDAGQSDKANLARCPMIMLMMIFRFNDVL